MKLSVPGSYAAKRHEERERRYPFYTAIDLALHWLLCLGVFTFAVGLLAIIMMNSSPQFYRQATAIARQVLN